MNYIRIDYKGNIQAVPDEILLKSISEEQGNILVVTGKHERSKVLFEALKDYAISGVFSAINMEIGSLYNKISIRSQLDWMAYSGMQLTCAYITRDADLNFVLAISSRCKEYPNLL
jgi:hypothetical protein